MFVTAINGNRGFWKVALRTIGSIDTVWTEKINLHQTCCYVHTFGTLNAFTMVTVVHMIVPKTMIRMLELEKFMLECVG